MAKVKLLVRFAHLDAVLEELAGHDLVDECELLEVKLISLSIVLVQITKHDADQSSERLHLLVDLLELCFVEECVAITVFANRPQAQSIETVAMATLAIELHCSSYQVHWVNQTVAVVHISL